MIYFRRQDRAVPAAVAIAMMLAIASPGDVLANRNIPVRITVYTVSTIPVSVPRDFETMTTVVHLDRVQDIEQELAEGIDRLPEHRREDAVSSRVTEDLVAELKRIMVGYINIKIGTITDLPAIVLDGQAVWYGADLRRAVTRYRNWKNAEAGS